MQVVGPFCCPETTIFIFLAQLSNIDDTIKPSDLFLC